MSKKQRRQANAEFEHMRQVIKASHVIYCPIEKDYIDQKECREANCMQCGEGQ